MSETPVLFEVNPVRSPKLSRWISISPQALLKIEFGDKSGDKDYQVAKNSFWSKGSFILLLIRLVGLPFLGAEVGTGRTASRRELELIERRRRI